MRDGLAWLVALGCCLGLGCGVTVNYHRLNPSPTDTARHLPEDVEIYTTTEPPYEYVDVGMLEVRQESAFSQYSERGVFRAMREEAGRRGCDGLIIMGAADAVVGSFSSDRYGGGGRTTTLHGYRATCIARIPTRRRPPPRQAIRKPPPTPVTAAPASYTDPFAGDGTAAPTSGDAPAAMPTCEPTCSPGYACQEGACVPSCNPPCAGDQTCGADRTCRSK